MRFTIRGTVQGVGFRPTVYRVAKELGRKGTVCNEGACVTVELDDGTGFIDALKASLPPLARIESVSEENVPFPPDINDFTIIPSPEGGHGVGIPADTAICPKCLAEIRSPGRRKGYAFTTCTECGARFTLMETAPYDRQRTSMDDFPRCPECGREYSDPSDRRFHHQTVCCPVCGPHYYLLDGDGKEIECDDPISRFAEMLQSGSIGIAKSWGGMHICSTLRNTPRLREWYRRPNKPFAIMVRDEDAVHRYSDPTEAELREMTSPRRPIVLVDKKDTVPEAISPGLDTVGMFLPYTGMQYLLFDALEDDALIMTSANIPGEPMILNDRDVLELGADCYLLHNQRIANRADDSVVKLYHDNTYFIRKSRGHIPSYLEIGLKGDAVGVGPQENLTATVGIGGRLYSTQHIGNGESYGVTEYLASATDSLVSMTGCEPDIVAMDLHPGYSNRRYANALAERFSADTVEVQHHWAHCASLMVDAGIDEMAALSVDGTGHGDDGMAWGGEVMFADLDGYERRAHLEYIPLIGGSKALQDIRRLRFAIDRMNGRESDFVTDQESMVFSKMMRNSIGTSSLGRILDALSYSLGVCGKRSYDGEPAMRLEPLLRRGRHIDGFDTETAGGIIRTAHLFDLIDTDRDRPEDIAYSIVESIIGEMVDSACDAANDHGVRRIGLTGGVSYSLPITGIFESKVREAGFEPVIHNRVPNGDGGVSVGQAAIALKRIQ